MQTTPTTVTIATLVGYVGDLVTEAVSWIGDYHNAIVSNPLILMFVIFALIGTGVGLIRRMIRL